MTTTVTIVACSDPTKRVRVSRSGRPDQVIAAGQSDTAVIWDDMELTVVEESVPGQAQPEGEAPAQG